MAMFAFQLPDDLAAKFDALASSGRSKKLRDLVAQAVGESASGPGLAPRGQSTKLTLRLKPDDLVALNDVSGSDGLRRTEWVLALLRRRLFGRPHFSRREELAFYAVQEELRRIGVNVNQIARAMNTAVMPGSVLDAEMSSIEAFRSEIREHVRGLSEAFKGNLAYWEDEA
ncbi:MobC family plasmid mobilization relaxosome protein [Caulobacter henricii]|uniref:Bacterial mobilisation domain-containing protein n=1 Tax=Caulobacter henricii TaxID=69395 RepID=A0A0N7JI81_9CAUL|nr:MobC family plasmid mobilization relaxosome protein [Caulobacter henricii]ALL15458.1 hypothetical protein AQ619_18405 [Caulobacter henricii]